MAEQEAPSAKKTVATWIKGGFTAIFGLVWGAVLMYLSPLVNSVIKPPKPVANFSVDQGQGMQVTFQNRTVGATDGWWDFGDGSALEPFSAHQPALPHTYTKPGAYTAKLSVHNLIGDESERTVNVQLDGTATPNANTATEVADLEAKSIRQDTTAPATFKIFGKVNNADLCVWAIDDRPIHLMADPPATIERYLTFRQPGQHTIRLAAVRGKQVVEKSVVVKVEQAAPASAAATATTLAVVNVTYEAQQVETKNIHRNVVIEFPRDFNAAEMPFQREIAPAHGFQIVKATLGQQVQHPGVRNVALALNPADGKLVLSCSLVKTAPTAGQSPDRAVAELMITEQRRGAASQQAGEPMVVALRLPGTTLVPLPPPPHGWESTQHKITFDLMDGQQVVSQHVSVPIQGQVTLQKHSWVVTATEPGNNQVRLDVVQAQTTPVGVGQTSGVSATNFNPGTH